MTLNIIASQVWQYRGGVLKCPGRPDRPVGPFGPVVVPPGDPNPGVTPFVLGTTEPDATNTGTASVANWATTGPDITSPLVITVPGTVIEYRNIKATIDIKAANVTIRYCNITGPTGAAAGRPLVYCLDAGASVTIQQCTIQPQNTDSKTDCVYGHDMHLIRNNMSHGVDIIGSRGATGQTVANNLIEGNYTWGHAQFTPDSSHSDNRTHNDMTQTFWGNGITWRGNSHHGYGDPAASNDTLGLFPAPYYTNALFEINAATQGAVDDLHIVENWLYGGISTINAADVKVTATIEIRDNRIMALPRGGRGGVIVTKTASNLTVTASGNTMADGSPITMTYGDGRTNI